MEVNIIDLAKGYFNNAAVSKIAESVGESPSNVQSALTSILPSLLAGVVQKTSTPSGTQGIMSLLNENDPDSITDKLPELLSNPAQFQKLITLGSGILPVLFGDKTEKVSDAISSQSGISKSSTSTLLGMAAPILISVIGKYFKTSGMGISGLASLLIGQKDNVKAALPAGVLSALNFADLGDFKDPEKVSVDYSHGPGYTAGAKKAGRRGWLPWLIGALVLLAILLTAKTCKKGSPVLDETAIKIDSAGSEVSDFADSVGSKMDAGLEALGNFFKRKLPNGVELNIPEFGVENKLVNFIEDPAKPADKTTWFNFDRINFETGSAKLSRESLEQTKNIAEILRAFPKVSLKVGGYTDNTGDPAFNVKLSQSRADAVKTAIVSEGIEAKRIDAEGYGKEHPVASNETEQGRTQNRRIAVRVTGK